MTKFFTVGWLEKDRVGARTKGTCVPAGKLDPKAYSDRTLCGKFVIMRASCSLGEVTCRACSEKLEQMAEEDRRALLRSLLAQHVGMNS